MGLMTRPGTPRLLAALATTIALLGPSADALANDKQICIAASEEAQQLRNAGKLIMAREQLGVCGRAVCPKVVQQDCTQWMSEVLALLPSVILAAKDAAGRDLVDVQVEVDGVAAAETLDGRPMAIDPGVHTLTFQANGAPPVEERVVVRQGEKNRIITVTIPTGGAPREPAPPEATATAAAPDPRPSAPVAAYVVGGLGVAALGAALFMTLDANADARNLRETCAPNCAQDDVDAIERRQVLSGVTAAVGGAAVIAGIVLFLVHPRGGSSRAAGPALSVQPMRSGTAGAVLRF
jgi:hypothetical protein